MPTWKLITDKLVIKNCLLLGNNSKFTSKKVTKYLLGARETIEIFKLYELRYLLLKIYPLVHNLFHPARYNSKIKFKDFVKDFEKSGSPLLPPSSDLSKNKASLWKTKFSFISKKKNTSPQILFATVTPALAKIIQGAAKICNMPWHENRWLSGSITAAISYPSDKLIWQYLQDDTQKEMEQFISKKWGLNKENKEKSKEKLTYYNRSRWPSLLVVPDISNNSMILKEARKVGLPVIGLINSNCQFEIDYPIFAQDQTLPSVYFFCHFLAALITKEALYTQHKRYTFQKTFSKVNKINSLTLNLENAGSKKEKRFSLLKGLKSQQIKEERKEWRKPFYFSAVKPLQERQAKSTFFAKKKKKDMIIFSKRFLYISKDWRPIFKRRRFRWLYRMPNKIFKKLPRRLKRNRSKEILIYQKQKQRKLRRYWKPHFEKKSVSLNSYPNQYPKIKFLKKNRVRFAIKKHLFQRFYGLKILAKKISKRQRKNLVINFLKKKTFLLEDKKKIQKEYLKKYYQKNVPSFDEKKQIYSKAKYFLIIPKIIRRYAIYRYWFTKIITFAPPTNYFWRTLQQWHQNLILQNFKMLTPLLLRVRFKKKPHLSNYRSIFYPGKSPKNTSLTLWEAWKAKNKNHWSNHLYPHPKNGQKRQKQNRYSNSSNYSKVKKMLNSLQVNKKK